MPTVLDFIATRGIKTAFSPQNYLNGRNYFRGHRVSAIQLSHPSTTESIIEAMVQGREPYTVRIRLHDTKHTVHIYGRCSCPMQVDCKHVVATLLQAIEQVSSVASKPSHQPILPNPTTITTIEDPKLKQWLNQLQAAMAQKDKPIAHVDPTYGLYYVLSRASSLSTQLKVELVLIRRLKAGGLGAPKSFSLTASSHEKHLYPIDKELLIKLEVVSKTSKPYQGYYGYGFVLGGALGERLLPELLATGRCHWQSAKNNALSLAEPQTAELGWDIDELGAQTFQFKANDKPYSVFFIEQSWYIDEAQTTVGPLNTGLDVDVAKLLLTAPQILPEHTKIVTDFLSKNEPVARIKPPKHFTKTITDNIRPVPCLRLFQDNIQTTQYYQTTTEPKALAELTFDYQGISIPWHISKETIHQVRDDTLITITRNQDDENNAVEMLLDFNLLPISNFYDIARQNAKHLNHFLVEHQTSKPLTVSTDILPQLQYAGWRIEFDAEYPYQIIDDPIDDWYSSIEEESAGYDWFGLELGVMIKGEKVNLLPVLQSLLKQMQQRNKLDIDDSQPIYAQLPNGHFISLPVDRVKNILNVLVELYDTESLSDDQQLRLSSLHATRLLELEAAMGAAKLRWLGGDRIRELGRKLTNFKGIETAEVPQQFLGQLRPYQLEGLSWLQFLREYQFGGVLADDMGLGKTVQALAHITLEKTSGRMNGPCLVIAPTSLMFNWQMEAKRFSPELKVLLLHGTERKNQFEHLSEYDLILTTYPLIVRDKAILLNQHFYLLILDEAQFIKNVKSQAAQIAIQLKASHRLCLTGTPMENHLGELWSLFHFMMPGLLGDQKTFTKLFRTPIEKHANQERRNHLNNRITPFLLRRTKDKVVQELPAKVEMIRHIDLEGSQRDLYETIRMTMQEKISREIAKLGLARSHIIILDALLKLRQVCCDPRLLKIKTEKKKTSKSAKLDLLMTIIPELLEEGRRIILFSQFTEMLGLIEDELNLAGINYVKLTGQTKDRATPVQQFQNEEVPLFLISLKAGGTGLNLTAADTVIHYDPWWNPAVENQATDRAHRIGQNKTVFVYKLVVKGTVEEKILEMQERKSALMEGLFSEGTVGKLAMTEGDLRGLFEPLEGEIGH
jgi:superfamily II DNA or RNA helicase